MPLDAAFFNETNPTDTMTAYLVTHVKVTDPQKYQAYTALTPAALQAAGGRMLARGPAEALEGDWADGRLIVLEFPSVEAARGFYDSPAYRGGHEGAQRCHRVLRYRPRARRRLIGRAARRRTTHLPLAKAAATSSSAIAPGCTAAFRRAERARLAARSDSAMPSTPGGTHC